MESRATHSPKKSRLREDPFERPLSNLVVDSCSSLFLKNCVAVCSQDVVDAADSQTLTEEGKFRLRVLTQLNTFVHCSNDVCLGQELLRDVLSGSDSDSECNTSSGDCGDFGHLRSNLGVGDVEFLQAGRHQDWVTHNVTIVHVPQVRQASILLQHVPRIVWFDCVSSRSVTLCTFHHPKESPPPRHFLQWWDECQCPSFAESGL